MLTAQHTFRYLLIVFQFKQYFFYINTLSFKSVYLNFHPTFFNKTVNSKLTVCKTYGYFCTTSPQPRITRRGGYNSRGYFRLLAKQDIIRTQQIINVICWDLNTQGEEY